MENDNDTKFVRFEDFCPKCEYKDKSSTAEPCNTCLETGARPGTWVPTEFKEKDNG